MLFRKFKNLNLFKNILVVYCLFLVISSVNAQTNISVEELAKTIHSNDLERHLSIIAADSMEGRETGQQGQKRAADYLASTFHDIGLLPVNIDGENTYFQTIELEKKYWGDIYVKVDEKRYENLQDVVFMGNTNGIIDESYTIAFAGYGTHRDLVSLQPKPEAIACLAYGDDVDWNKKVELATRAGIENVFLIYGEKQESFGSVVSLYRSQFNSSLLDMQEKEDSSSENSFFISANMAEDLFDTSMEKLINIAKKSSNGKHKALKKVRNRNISCYVERIHETLLTENVLGMVKGTDKPEEVIVISAHYDHLGKKEDLIYNGADDDGSGTVALLEIAEAFQVARHNNTGPRRSVLFIAFTGEEKGLLGSEYYVDNPIFPIDKTVANFNIDMIGRIDNSYVDNPDYVYIIGADRLSDELHSISERNNENHINLHLDYTYNEEDDVNRYYYRSDHYNFAKNGVPSIFYFTGVHDDYHRPTDTIDKILFGRMERIVKLVFYTSWEVANKENRLILK